MPEEEGDLDSNGIKEAAPESPLAADARAALEGVDEAIEAARLAGLADLAAESRRIATESRANALRAQKAQAIARRAVAEGQAAEAARARRPTPPRSRPRRTPGRRSAAPPSATRRS